MEMRLLKIAFSLVSLGVAELLVYTCIAKRIGMDSYTNTLLFFTQFHCITISSLNILQSISNNLGHFHSMVESSAQIISIQQQHELYSHVFFIYILSIMLKNIN